MFVGLNLRGETRLATDGPHGTNLLASDEIAWGWPAAIYVEYGHGYIHQFALAAYDVDPVFSRFSSLALVFNLSMALVGGLIISHSVVTFGKRNQLNHTNNADAIKERTELDKKNQVNRANDVDADAERSELGKEGDEQQAGDG